MQGTTPPAAGPRLKLDPVAFYKRLDPMEHGELYKLTIDMAAVAKAYTIAELQAMGLTVSTT